MSRGMRTFEYSRAGTIEEALSLLGQDGEGLVRPLAGGTDLLPLMKADIVAPTRLIDIKRASDLPSGIDETRDGLEIGALTTLTEIETSQVIRERYTALAEAAAIAASPQLRNMATIGGNLLQRPRCWYYRSSHFNCWLKGGAECFAREGENQYHALFGQSPCVAVHPSDPASALLAFDASVVLQSQNGERVVKLAELFAEPDDDRRTETTVRPDEILTEVRIPGPAAGTKSTYLKAMDRKVWAFALVGVAAIARIENGLIRESRIVLSGVAPTPWRAAEAEMVLAGQSPGEELFQRAASAALAGARPLAKNGYKIPLADALIRRALSTVTA